MLPYDGISSFVSPTNPLISNRQSKGAIDDVCRVTALITQQGWCGRQLLISLLRIREREVCGKCQRKEQRYVSARIARVADSHTQSGNAPFSLLSQSSTSMSIMAHVPGLFDQL